MPDATDTYFDRQEVREPGEREAAMFRALPGLLRHAIDNSPYFKTSLADIEPRNIQSREALAGLPLLRKGELSTHQRTALPFGGLTATPIGRLARIYASPGPTYDPEGARTDYWRFARALYAAGFRAGDIVHNSFSYHLTPAGQMVDAGARMLGCPVVPAGTGQTEIQIGVINDVRPAGYAGTPSYLAILLDRAREQGTPISSLTKALVGGEAFTAALRETTQAAGIDVFQCYGTADVGLIAYESAAREGLILDESAIVEIVRPGTGDPVAAGEVGEVVVTVFNPDYPLIRLATGDLSKELTGASACGRTNRRLAGWMGRADQTAKVRGMFVRPDQVAKVVARFPEIARGRLVVHQQQGHDVMELHCEAQPAFQGAADKVTEAVRQIIGLRADVIWAEPGSLANDGKVIEDRRPVG